MDASITETGPTLIDKVGYWADKIFGTYVTLEQVKAGAVQPSTTAPTSGNAPTGGSIIGGLTMGQLLAGSLIVGLLVFVAVKASR